MTETREQMEARHAAEIAALEARAVEPDDLLKRYDAAVAKQYSMGGYSTGHGVGRVASHRDRLQQAQEVGHLRDEIVKALTREPIAADLVGEWPGEDFLTTLREVNGERAEAWLMGQRSDPLFWAVELGGEVGEILNVVKKLVREELGWRGSRATVQDLADEIADGVICLDSLACHYGIDLASAVAAKFNATSEKNGFPHRLRSHLTQAAKPTGAYGKVHADGSRSGGQRPSGQVGS